MDDIETYKEDLYIYDNHRFVKVDGFFRYSPRKICGVINRHLFFVHPSIRFYVLRSVFSEESYQSISWSNIRRFLNLNLDNKKSPRFSLDFD